MIEYELPRQLPEMVERLAEVVGQHTRALAQMRVELGAQQTAFKIVRESLVASGVLDDGAARQRPQVALDLMAADASGEGRQYLEALRTELEALLGLFTPTAPIAPIAPIIPH